MALGVNTNVASLAVQKNLAKASDALSTSMTRLSAGLKINCAKDDAAGLQIVKSSSLVTGLSGPLALAADPAGHIFVAEFNSDRVTALRYIDPGCWQQLTAAPQALLNAAAGAIGDSIYLVGGRAAGGLSSAAFAYNKLAATWSAIAPVPGAPVEQAAAAVVGTRLYLFGGRTASAAASTAAYVYDSTTGSWSALPSLPSARSAPTATVINGKIYLAGGVDASGTSQRTVTVFNPSTGTYSSAADMTVARDSAVAAAVSGKLYVFGGRQRAGGADIAAALATAEVYDAGSDSWVPIADMLTGRRAAAIGTLNGKIQVVGGELNTNNPTGVFRANEQYDPQTNLWEKLTDVPNARQGAAHAMSNGVLYVIGGGLQSGNAFSDLLESY